MYWNYVPAYAPTVNIFQVYDIFSGRLIHQITNFDFYLYLQENASGQCFESSNIGCMKAYLKPSDFNTAYFDFYGELP